MTRSGSRSLRTCTLPWSSPQGRYASSIVGWSEWTLVVEGLLLPGLLSHSDASTTRIPIAIGFSVSCTASRTASRTCSRRVIPAQIGAGLHSEKPINTVFVGDLADLRTGSHRAQHGGAQAGSAGDWPAGFVRFRADSVNSGLRASASRAFDSHTARATNRMRWTARSATECSPVPDSAPGDCRASRGQLSGLPPTGRRMNRLTASSPLLTPAV